MPRLLLHVGPAKTATTYIQRALAGGRARLRAEGVVYPRMWAGGRDRQHHHAFTEAIRSWPEPHGDRGPQLDEWLGAVGRSRADAVVVSSEGLPGLAEHQWAMLGEAAATHGFELEIVMFLRRRSRRMVSSWSQHVKEGMVEALPDYCAERTATNRGGYGTFLRRMRTVVPAERIHLVVLDDLAADPVDHLCREVIGVEPAGFRPPDRDANLSMSLMRMEVLRLLNVRNARGPETIEIDDLWRRFGRLKVLHSSRLAAVETRLAGLSTDTPDYDVSWVDEHFAPDDEYLAREFDGRIVPAPRDGAVFAPLSPSGAAELRVAYVDGSELLDSPELERLHRFLLDEIPNVIGPLPGVDHTVRRAVNRVRNLGRRRRHARG